MSLSKVEFCHLFLETMPSIEETAASTFKEYTKAFDKYISGQNPQQISAYAQKELKKIEVDESLLSLYHNTADFMSEIGDGLYEDMPIVVDIAETALRITGKKSLSASLMRPLSYAVEAAVVGGLKRDALTRLLKQNATNVQEYRLAQLETATRFGRGGAIELGESEEEEEASSGFTLSQQALALHLLLTEGMEVSGVDQTKVIALAHLLSGKKIPIKAGKENIANSGIKSAFGKMWQKSDKGQLADLCFVLRFFKPFEGTSSEGMNRIIKAIEREIAKVEARLRKANANK